MVKTTLATIHRRGHTTFTIEGELPPGEYFEIQRTSGLYLPTFCHGNVERFVRVFRETWRSLPAWARRRLVKYWRTSDRRMFVGLVSPQIELTEFWDYDRVGPAFGVCSMAGHSLKFFAPVVDIMPDNVVATLIAHELAHVLQWTVSDLAPQDDSITDESAVKYIAAMNELFNGPTDHEEIRKHFAESSALSPAEYVSQLLDEHEGEVGEIIDALGYRDEDIDDWLEGDTRSEVTAILRKHDWRKDEPAGV